MAKKYFGRELMDIKVLWNVPIRMRDGITLYADVYRPNNDIPYPAIVNRTPYLKESMHYLTGYSKALLLAGCGYNVVIQDVRGTGYSEGICDPAGHQDEDGYDTVEGLAAMPWCDGNVGMVGESYNGFSQLTAARSNPPHLRTIVPAMTSWTKFPGIYDFGIFSPVLYGWIHGRALDREKYYPGQYSPEAIQAIHETGSDMAKQAAWLPMIEMPAANIDGVPELHCHRDLLANIDNEDYLEDIGRAEGFEKTTVPTLNVTGWNDFLRDKTIYNFTQFQKRGGSKEAREGARLVVGPWFHSANMEGVIEGVDYGPEASCEGAKYTERLIGWYDRWLKGIPGEFSEGAPVRLFVMGKNIWRDEQEWPLKRTRYTSFYLHSGGHANTLAGDGLLTEETPLQEPADHYDYDPMNPCPSDTGERGLMLMQDQQILQRRSDVLVYTTPVFTRETEITGPITARIYASSSARDTDFVARVGVVRKDGSVYRLGALLVRARYRFGKVPRPLEPGEVFCYTIAVGNTSIVLQSGEAIRLDITSSLFPDADRNLNTYGKVGFESEGIVAHQTILHDNEHPSVLILPFIPETTE